MLGRRGERGKESERESERQSERESEAQTLVAGEGGGVQSGRGGGRVRCPSLQLPIQLLRARVVDVGSRRIIEFGLGGSGTETREELSPCDTLRVWGSFLSSIPCLQQQKPLGGRAINRNFLFFLDFPTRPNVRAEPKLRGHLPGHWWRDKWTALIGPLSKLYTCSVAAYLGAGRFGESRLIPAPKLIFFSSSLLLSSLELSDTTIFEP